MDFINISFSIVHVCQLVVQSILEGFDGGRVHNMRRMSVPIVVITLCEKKFITCLKRFTEFYTPRQSCL